MSRMEPSYRDGSYHAAVFSADPSTENLLAGRRQRKLQRHVAESDSVLEFGVGTGLNLRLLRCARKVGYDVTQDLAERCARIGVEPCADLELAGRFDVVIAHHVLEHVTDPFDVLRRLAGRLADGGKLLIYVPLEVGRRYRRYTPGDVNMHLYSWNALTLGNLLTAAGLDVESVRVRPYGYEQRLAPVAKVGNWAYELALAAARAVRPCDEIEAVARSCGVGGGQC